MDELKSYVCPHCGAHITNRCKCEYCGSLLIASAGKDVDLQEYLENLEMLPGLVNELKRNLELKEQNQGEVVATDIFGTYRGEPNFCFVSVISAPDLIFEDGTYAFPNAGRGLGIIFGFDVGEANEEERQTAIKEHKRFKRMAIAQLFKGNIYVENSLGWKDKVYEYAIDMGEDCIGAARLISDVLQEVYKLPIDKALDYYTKVGDDISKNREKLSDKEMYEKAAWEAVGITVGFYLLLCLVAYLFGTDFELDFGLIVSHLVMLVGAFGWRLDVLEKKKKRLVT